MVSDPPVELVIKLYDHVQLNSAEHECVRSALRDVGIQLDDDASKSTALDKYTFIVPRGVASRAVDALKGNTAVEGAFVKPRGETP